MDHEAWQRQGQALAEHAEELAKPIRNAARNYLPRHQKWQAERGDPEALYRAVVHAHHAWAIKDAIRAGKSVLVHVLAEHPELIARRQAVRSGVACNDLQSGQRCWMASPSHFRTGWTPWPPSPRSRTPARIAGGR